MISAMAEVTLPTRHEIKQRKTGRSRGTLIGTSIVEHPIVSSGRMVNHVGPSAALEPCRGDGLQGRKFGQAQIV